MPIILLNLRIENCEICVDIGDYANQGIEGTLKFEIAGQPPKERKVNLFYPLRTERIPSTTRTGKIHTVKATLTADSESKEEVKPLQFCA